VGEVVRRLGHGDDDAAEPAAVGGERRDDVLALHERLAAAEALELRRVEGERLLRSQSALGHLPREPPREHARPLLVAVARDRPRDELAGRRILEPDGRPRRAEDGRRELDDTVEDLVETLRARELAPELEQRLGALR